MLMPARLYHILNKIKYPVPSELWGKNDILFKIYTTPIKTHPFLFFFLGGDIGIYIWVFAITFQKIISHRTHNFHIFVWIDIYYIQIKTKILYIMKKRVWRKQNNKIYFVKKYFKKIYSFGYFIYFFFFFFLFHLKRNEIEDTAYSHVKAIIYYKTHSIENIFS